MSNFLIDKINQLKYRTKSYIDSYQSENTIRYYDLKLNREMSYVYNTITVSVGSKPNLSLYSCKNLPIGPYVNNRKAYFSFSNNMTVLVDKEVIYPFLLFIGGKVIPWSKITIIKDINNSYILIDKQTDINDSVASIILPFSIIYGEDDMTSSKYQGLYFNSKGYYCYDNLNNIKLRVEFTDSRYVIQNTLLEKDGSNIVKFWADDYEKIYITSDSNILYMKHTDEGYILSTESISLEHKGFGVYETDSTLKQNDVILFTFNTKCYNNISYIDSLSLETKKNIMDAFYDSYNTSSDNTLAGSILTNIFDFKYDYEKSPTENLINQLNYIMDFNSEQLLDLFEMGNNILIESYTGKEMNTIAKGTNLAVISRIRSNNYIDSVIIFKNGKLYDYYYKTIIKNSSVYIPLYNISNDDYFTLVFFKNINNEIYDINIPDNETIIDYSSMISDNDLELYYNGFLEEMSYEYDLNEKTIFKLDFTIDDHKYIFDNENCYDKDLKLGSKRQFRYSRYTGLDNVSKLVLGSKFMYCKNKSQYMIFINKVKLNSDNFAFCTPTSTSPFKYNMIYFPVILEPTDIVEVFYLPGDIFTREKSDLSLSGDISVDYGEKNNHYLSKHLQLIFINGNIIPKKDIIDISKNHIRIKSSMSTHNITIIDTVDSVELLARLISTTIINSYVFSECKYGDDIDTKALIPTMKDMDAKDDKWSTFIKGLSEEQITILYGAIENIGTEENMNNSFNEINTALYDMLYKEYIQPYAIIPNQEFVFDYEDTSIDIDYEEGKTRALSFMDGRNKDKLYQYEIYNEKEDDENNG